MHYLYLKYLYFVGTQKLAIVFLLDIFGQTDILSLLQYLKKQFILCWGNIFYICRQLESWLYCLVLMQISGKMLFYCNTWFSFQTHNVANILFLYVVSNIIFDIILSFYFFYFYFCLLLLFWFPGYVYIFCLAVEHQHNFYYSSLLAYFQFCWTYYLIPHFKIW